MTAPSADRREAAEDMAAQWAIRLGGGPLSDGERHGLERWLAEDASHGAALDFALSTWARLGDLRAAPGGLIRHAQPRRRAWVNAAVLAASLLLAAALGLSWLGDPWLALTADARTAPGETRALALEDGSRVELAPASALAVRYDGHQRRVELLAGRAFFAPVAREQAGGRPFVVTAGGGSATALGTRFMVDRRDDGGVAVIVVEHTVEVAVATGGSVRLSPGQTVRYDDGAGLGPVGTADIRRSTAWRDGRLIFDRVPLAEVVAELNRYRRGRIILAPGDLAGRTVSGVFDTARLDGALDSIGQELGIRSASLPPFLTVLY